MIWLVLACTRGDGPADKTPGDSAGHSAGDSEPLVEWCSPDAPALPADLTADQWTRGPELPAGDIVQLVEADDGTLFAGSWLAGVFLSKDNATWERADFGVTHVYGQMTIQPDDSSRLAFTSDHLNYSSDGGETWGEWRVDGEPGNDGLIRGMTFHDGELLLLTAGATVYVFDWETGQATHRGDVPDAPGGPPPHTSKTLKQSAWMADTGTAVLAHMGGRSLYRSEDAGVTWDEVQPGRIVGNTLHVGDGQIWAVGQEDAYTVYTSTDDGKTWTAQAEIPVEVYDLTVHDGVIVAAADESLYTGTTGTLARTDVDQGHYFTSVHSTGDGALLVGHSNGILRSEDGGDTWTEMDDGLLDRDAALVMSVDACPGTVFVGTRCRSGMYRSADWGATYERIDAYFHYVMVMDIHSRRTREIWATSDESILRSEDFGASWEISKVNVADPEGFGRHVHGISSHPTNDCEALVGSVGSGIWFDESGRVYKTTDCGENWVNSSEGIPQTEASVHGIHHLEADPSVVLAGTFRGGDIAHDGAPGIGLFRSTDAGDSWTQVGPDGLEDVPYVRECGDRVYAATNVGVIGSDDQGATWTVMDSATPGEQVLALDCQDETVLAFRYDGSLRRSDDAGATWSDFTDGLANRVQGADAPYTASLDIAEDGSFAWVTPGEDSVYYRLLD